MKYILINLMCFGMLAYSFSLYSNDKDEEKEATQDFEPDWDKTVRDIEAQAEVHQSWDTWGIFN